ncbi:MAG: hypothetical protein OHK0037_08160 [Elainellaceae cyanobacterium]
MGDSLIGDLLVNRLVDRIKTRQIQKHLDWGRHGNPYKKAKERKRIVKHRTTNRTMGGTPQ